MEVIAKTVSAALLNRRSLRKEILGIVSGKKSISMQDTPGKGQKKSNSCKGKKKASWRDDSSGECIVMWHCFESQSI